MNLIERLYELTEGEVLIDDKNIKTYDLIKNVYEESYTKEFIEKSIEKYSYIVGIKGSKLLGIQKQRVAIARAIFVSQKY